VPPVLLEQVAAEIVADESMIIERQREEQEKKAALTSEHRTKAKMYSEVTTNVKSVV
jgi:hypothetical protein